MSVCARRQWESVGCCATSRALAARPCSSCAPEFCVSKGTVRTQNQTPEQSVQSSRTGTLLAEERRVRWPVRARRPLDLVPTSEHLLLPVIVILVRLVRRLLADEQALRAKRGKSRSESVAAGYRAEHPEEEQHISPICLSPPLRILGVMPPLMPPCYYRRLEVCRRRKGAVRAAMGEGLSLCAHIKPEKAESDEARPFLISTSKDGGGSRRGRLGGELGSGRNAESEEERRDKGK
eukprot:scaffold128027_cov31-Tisochrysis_lutea.AAC.4